MVCDPSYPSELVTTEEHRHYKKASKRFAAMLLEMRSHSIGGFKFLEGLDQLFKVGPSRAKDKSSQGLLEGRDALIGVADANFFQLQRLSVHVLDRVKDAQASPDAFEYEQLSAVVEADVAPTTKIIRSNEKSAEMWRKLAHKKYCLVNEERTAERALSPAELIVHIPLTMYVQNTLHLYEMLARLNSEVARGCENAKGPGAASPFFLQLRVILDSNGQPYSWFVFAIMAALQILFQARDKLLAGEHGKVTNPLHLLASNPVPSRDRDATKALTWTDADEPGLMFRGIWAGPCIDEHRARHPYAFNSWSRSLSSVLFVLDFYGKCLPIAKAPDWHILLLIARKWHQNPWVLPVQFFGGPEVGDAEKELMVPPFVSLKLESDLELRSGMSHKELKEQAQALVDRWGLRRKRVLRGGAFCVRDPLDDLGEMVGPELWQLLTRKPGLVSNEVDETLTPTCAPHVTVRFVTEIEPLPALRSLFEDKNNWLLDFPPAS